jgi:hypothetical protein
MFPARKLFLEGLFKLGLIRYTRLMLGRMAEESVRRMLEKEVQTTFVRLEGSMSDKAVIYLDCGDFHLVEGSHSFKIWVYLAQPGGTVKSYDRTVFTHADLTGDLPRQYKKLYPHLGYEAITHIPMWQRKVFDFLTSNGIAVDVESLLSKRDYRLYLSRYGVPTVQSGMAQIPTPQKASGVPIQRKGSKSNSTQDHLVKQLLTLTTVELQVLRYFARNPGDKARYAANVLKVETQEINRLLYDPLRSFCTQVRDYSWSVKADVLAALERLSTER